MPPRMGIKIKLDGPPFSIGFQAQISNWKHCILALGRPKFLSVRCTERLQKQHVHMLQIMHKNAFSVFSEQFSTYEILVNQF